MFNETEGIKDSLTRQQDFLVAVRERQIRWADITADPETAQLHLETAELLRQSIQKYTLLLDIYRKHVE